MSSLRLFVKETWNNFHQTGAVAPSSRYLAKAITRQVSRKSEPASILEVGAGTGAFTRELLGCMDRGDMLDIYEINPQFIPVLDALIASYSLSREADRPVKIHQENILSLRKENFYDFVVSGLPLNNFSPRMVHEILDVLIGSMRTGGILCYFEYMGIRRVKAIVSKKNEKQRLRNVSCLLREFHAKYRIETIPVWFNLPPACVHVIRKPGSSAVK